MKLVAATNNSNKLREFKEILSPLGFKVISQIEAGIDTDVEETGLTFAENAFLKAEAVYSACQMGAVADDSGLEVDELNNEPGVHSARYTGNHSDSDEDRCRLVLSKMKGKKNRDARFVASICCILDDNKVLRCEGVCNGVLAEEMKGENGFGYDCIFIPNGYSVTMAELSAEEKNKISHRGMALKELAEELRSIYNAK
ncbi:MAG: RdgB/HAM1 family non-canonical purine NTP pyrophosphatase [Ruminococcaceae bacterium]|nr:RdgB/HAM1 family non-canonical purine NTP pyrophosphatase [Oscillospiraceae bacterium]